MKRMMIAGAMAMALAGIGHNMPPTPVPAPMHEEMQRSDRVRRRHNKKLWQKMRRRPNDRPRYHDEPRITRKVRKFGPGYRAGKLFKGHRI